MTKKPKTVIENIELSLPVNAAYVSAARLTASSIANRLGFDVSEIEDIKAAVSEACTFIIKKADKNKNNAFNIMFIMQEGFLEININSEVSIDLAEIENEMSLVMIKALMDDLSLSMISKECLEMKMTRQHKENII